MADSSKQWFDTRIGAAALAALALLAAYAVGSLALDRGNILLYLSAFFLAGLAVNRAVHAVKLILGKGRKHERRQ